MRNCKDLNINYQGGDLDISREMLISLAGCPEYISGNFYCYDNELTSLVGGPQQVDGHYGCRNNNKLTALEGCASHIGGYFGCALNNLTSLVGGPQQVDGDYNCEYNNLTALEGCANYIGGALFCSNNPKISSLVCIHKIIKRCSSIYFDCDQIIQGGIGLLLIENLTNVSHENDSPFKIIQSYLGTGTKGMMECSKELTAKGFEQYAKL